MLESFPGELQHEMSDLELLTRREALILKPDAIAVT